MLAGNVFDGSVLHRLGLQCCVTFKGEDDLSDLDLLALLDSDFLDYSGYRRRNFDNRLVSFKFHDGLALGNLGTRRNHQSDEIALLDVLAKFRQSEFRSRRRRRRSLAALDLRLRSLCWFLLRCLWLRWLGLGFRNFRFSFGFCSSTVLNCEDDLADFDFLAFFYSLLDLLYFDLFFTRQRVQRCQHNVFGVNFEKITQ